jgi:hypothetical protein
MGKSYEQFTAACYGALLPTEDSFRRVPTCTCPFTSGLIARAAPVGGALRPIALASGKAPCSIT